MLRRMFRPGPVKASSERLYASAVTQARSPGFYRDLGVEDRIDARFELYTIHVALLAHRLGGQGEQAAETAQTLIDTYMAALDDTLRELGVGDISVAKKIRPLAEALVGRMRAYDDALGDEPDRQAITGLIARTVFGDEGAIDRAGALADYVIGAERALASQPLAEILKGAVAWPAPAPELANEPAA